MEKPFDKITIQDINTNSNITIIKFIYPKILQFVKVTGLYIEDEISKPFYSQVWCCLKNYNHSQIQKMLGEKVLFVLDSNSCKNYFSGFIKTIEIYEHSKSINNATICLEIYSNLEKLNMNKKSHIYNNMSYSSIFEKTCSLYNIKCQNKTIKKCEKMDFIIQMDESDLNFSLRILNKIKYYFVEDRSNDKNNIYIIDDIVKCQTINNVYIEKIYQKHSKIINNFKIIKYSFTNAVKLETIHKDNLYKHNVYEQTVTDIKTNIFNNFYNIVQEQDGGWFLSNSKYVFAGQSIIYNKKKHICLSSFIRIDDKYNVNYIFINNNINNIFTPVKTSHLHAQTAIVIGDKNNDIVTDKLGRIKIRFIWDKEGYIFARFCNIISGRNFGFFFVPRYGQEVIVSFLFDNIDEPIIIGSLYNNTNAPFMHKNRNSVSYIKTQTVNSSCIKNKYDNMLLFDDKPNEETLELSSSKDFIINSSNRISINNENNIIITSKGKELKITSENGNFILSAKACKLDINDKISLLSNGDIEIKSNKNIVIKSQGDIDLNAGKSINMKANNKISLNALNIDAQAKMNLGLQANLNLNLNSKLSSKIESNMLSINGKIKCDVSSSGMMNVDGTLNRVTGKLTSIEGLIVKIN